MTIDEPSIDNDEKHTRMKHNLSDDEFERLVKESKRKLLIFTKFNLLLNLLVVIFLLLQDSSFNEILEIFVILNMITLPFLFLLFPEKIIEPHLLSKLRYLFPIFSVYVLVLSINKVMDN